MSRFWHGEYHDVEVELDACRPEPRAAFLADLGETLDARRRHPRAARRAALAAVLTVGMLSLFATLGGIGYASSAANSAFHVSKIERLVGISHQSSPAVQNGSATGDNPVFGDQYRPGKGCGDKNHIHARRDECKK